jgi:TonB family protein
MNNPFKIIARVALLSFFLATSSAKADFELGLKYYEQANYEKAYQEFTQAAKYGDFSAQFNLGVMYYKGQFVKQDVVTGYAWLSLAAQDTEYKERALHLQIYKGFSEEQKKQADKAAQEIFDQFSIAAITLKLAPSYSEATPLSTKLRAKKKVYPDYPDIMLERGVIGWVDVLYTVEKDGTTRDHVIFSTTHEHFSDAVIEALRQWQYEPKQVAGKAVAVHGVQMRFIFKFEELAGNKKIVDEALAEHRSKAYKGDADAQFFYGYYLDTLPTFTKEMPKEDANQNANDWYLKAAKNGNVIADFFLGKNTLNGNMCTADSQKSMGWLQKSASKNIVDAQYFLARELLSGAHFQKNEEQAMYWLNLAAVGKSKARSMAKLRLAWILASHPNNAQRNGALAQQYIQEVDSDYYDKQTYYQTYAAVAAENGDFNAAIDWQEEALADAKSLNLPLDAIREQLNAYIAKKPLREIM